MSGAGGRLQRIFLLSLLAMLLLSVVAAAQGINGTAEEEPGPKVLGFGEAGVADYIPIGAAFLVAIFIWRFLVPINLSSLQVAFEVDDDLYEVHRLTRTRTDARGLLRSRGVWLGLVAYILAMMGVFILVVELINPFETEHDYSVIALIVTGGLILVPIVLSPWETLNAQLSRTRSAEVRQKLLSKLIRRFGTLGALLAATGGIVVYAREQDHPGSTAQWYFYALLVFMAPSIIAYGRIMGASWNMLILNKWRTARGQRTPVNPDKPNVFNRLTALALVLFVLTMPLTAINGVLTVATTGLNLDEDDNGGVILDPADEEVLNQGGLLGNAILKLANLNPELLDFIGGIKTLEQTLALYLTLNVIFVGLAFIFEVARIMFLGGQAFGGVGGVTLAPPREIRSEHKVQGRLLFFCFAGFSGYTTLLIIMICYKEFSHLMPGTAVLSDIGAGPVVILLSTWYFIAAGQAFFLLTWTMSLLRFGTLRRLRFDLAPDERREGAIMAGGGDWMQELVDNAAYADDLDTLRRFQKDAVAGDQSIVRLQKSRARMLENALRGMWPAAAEEARKVLAQQGGDDDEARMLICAAHVTCRRLDAAREALRGLEQPDGYDEPELLAFILEWLDPWKGQATLDDLYDWENVSTIDHLRTLDEKLSSWDPTSQLLDFHDDRLSFMSELSSVAKMRAQRMHDEALEVAIKLIRKEPNNVRARLALALCLLDQGESWAAMDVWVEARHAAPRDPRIDALGGILGHAADTEQMEAALAVGRRKERKRWIEGAPANAVAALSVTGGKDEALTANYWVAGGEAVERNVSPHVRRTGLGALVQYILLWGGAAYAIVEYGAGQGNNGVSIAAVTVLVGHLVWRRILRNSMRLIKHRDQAAMVVQARRLTRRKVRLDTKRIPVGTHLILSGLLVTINGNVFDLGYPAWLSERLPKEPERRYQQRMKKRQRRFLATRSAQLKPLEPEWWQRRTRDDEPGLLLKELLGVRAEVGDQSGDKSLPGKGERRVGVQTPRQRVGDTDYESRHIPHDSRKSEKAGPASSPLDIPGLIPLPGKGGPAAAADDDRPVRKRGDAGPSISKPSRSDFTFDD